MRQDTDPFYQHVGEKIRQKRVLKGLSQDNVALLSGLSAGYYPHLERGEYNGSLKAYFNIASVLGTSLDMLVQDAYNPDSDAFVHAVANHLGVLSPEQRKLVLRYVETLK